MAPNPARDTMHYQQHPQHPQPQHPHNQQPYPNYYPNYSYQPQPQGQPIRTAN